MTKRQEAKPGFNARLYRPATVTAMREAARNHPQIRVVTGQKRRNYAGEQGIPAEVVGLPADAKQFWKDVWGLEQDKKDKGGIS